jgi:hypothetical protein
VLLGDRGWPQLSVWARGVQRDGAIAVLEVAGQDAVGVAIEHTAAEAEGELVGVDDTVAQRDGGWGGWCAPIMA